MGLVSHVIAPLRALLGFCLNHAWLSQEFSVLFYLFHEGHWLPFRAVLDVLRHHVTFTRLESMSSCSFSRFWIRNGILLRECAVRLPLASRLEIMPWLCCGIGCCLAAYGLPSATTTGPCGPSKSAALPRYPPEVFPAPPWQVLLSREQHQDSCLLNKHREAHAVSCVMRCGDVRVDQGLQQLHPPQSLHWQ